MSKWSREQRFDMKVLAALALVFLVAIVVMLTFASDVFWEMVG